jgi:hypothetical protein
MYDRLSDINNNKKIKKNTVKPFGVNLWIGPFEHNENKGKSSVQQFLNKNIRQHLGIPLQAQIF